MTDSNINSDLFSYATPVTIVLPSDPTARLELLESAIRKYSNAQMCQSDGHKLHQAALLTENQAFILRGQAAAHQGMAAVYAAGAELIGIGKALVSELTDRPRADVAKGPGGINEEQKEESERSMVGESFDRLKGIDNPHDTAVPLYGASATHCCSCRFGGGNECVLHLGPTGEPVRIVGGLRSLACLGGEQRLVGTGTPSPTPEPEPIYRGEDRVWYETGNAPGRLCWATTPPNQAYLERDWIVLTLNPDLGAQFKSSDLSLLSSEGLIRAMMVRFESQRNAP